MELAMELLSHILAQGEVQVIFPQQTESFAQIVEGKCYQTLCKIKAILEDDRLDDGECFQKIEEIVRTFEELGSGGGTRHDFN